MNSEKKCIKVVSADGKQYYKSADPQYYNNYFKNNKKLIECDICGKTVTCQLYSHKRSKACIFAKQNLEIAELKKELIIFKNPL